MKTNTMILAVLLFISVLGNILLIINPENVSKVHNLTSMHTSNATSHEKTTTISENIFEITDIEIIKDKYRGILPSIDVVLIHFSCKNMLKPCKHSIWITFILKMKMATFTNIPMTLHSLETHINNSLI